MSTPRQKCPCGYDHCGYYVDENGEVVEGVAAPLEPSALPTPKEFWREVNCFPREILAKLTLVDCGKLGKIIVEAIGDYAAAVSKNLQEELTRSEQRIRGLMEAAHSEVQLRKRAEAAESRIAELEKEIAALREKPI